MRMYGLLFAALSAGLLASAGLAQVPRVVVDMPVTGALAALVLGDLGAPTVLLSQGADAHEFQLRPSQAQDLAQADLLFWIGPQMTPWLARALDAGALGGRALTLLDQPGVTLLAINPQAVQHHGHAADAGHASTGKDDHAVIDPHAWLDPQNAKLWIGVMAQALSEADPGNAASFAANAAAARRDIDLLTADVQAILRPVGATPVVLFHDAYAYFAAAFGLHIAATLSENDAQRPGAARIMEIRHLLGAAGGICLFPEANHDPKYLETVAEGTATRIGQPLDPEGTTLAYGPALYGALLHGLARKIADCVTQAQ